MSGVKHEWRLNTGSMEARELGESKGCGHVPDEASAGQVWHSVVASRRHHSGLVGGSFCCHRRATNPSTNVPERVHPSWRVVCLCV